jgi:hypothetical protein
MPKIYCCLCSRRTDTNKQRVRIGTASMWSMFKIHAEKNGLDLTSFSADDHICMKCHATIAHYCMKDRGPNKKMKVAESIDSDPIIKKNVLRSVPKYPRSSQALSSTEIISGNPLRY